MHAPIKSEALDARRFLKELREEIRLHPAVNHIFLNRVATTPFTKQDFKTFGLQHYPLVSCFTTYMENLLIGAPDSEAKRWLAKVLIDEYGEGSDGHDHSTLYFSYLRAAGATREEIDQTILSAYTVDFIKTHMELTTKAPFLVGLGAIGPGHEWAIPRMFDAIVPGLRRAGFAEDDIRYFWLHQDQDEDHGTWLEEALVRYATNDVNRRHIREGALASLAARERFWTGVQSEVVRSRQPISAKTFVRNVRVASRTVFAGVEGFAGKSSLAGRAMELARRHLAPVYFEDVVPRQRKSPHLS
jgi:pyrroloquinoline quinone (PQQ) biosynthesis protein C